MDNKTSAGKKDGGWLVGLFALPFAGVGLGLLVMSVIPTLYQWSRMQHWQLATATLSHAYLQSHPGDDSTTYSVSASYTYTIDGVTYNAFVVAFDFTDTTITGVINVFADRNVPPGTPPLFSVEFVGQGFVTVTTNPATGSTLTVFTIATPEPASLLLIGMGVTGLAVKLKRSRKLKSRAED